jgi:catechol 2,3-dioxygenase-like lactoylglutathione lyase family enzyme
MPVIESAKATHTTLETASVPRAMRFYKEVLGLRTHQVLEKAGHLIDTRGVYAAYIELPKRGPQPFLNFYARPVPDAAAVDAVHARISAVQGEWGIQEITAPAREDPTKFGVGTYGFYLKDADANWWRIEENDGPFGPMEIAPDAEPRDSIVPAGPISYVTLECRNVEDSMRFYHEFLGLDVERRDPHFFFTRGNGGVNMIVVERADELVEQTVLNHHGITLWTDESKIDELHAAAEAHKEEFGIKKIMIATHQHGSYSFYMQDRDTNWWEIEVWDGHVDPWTQTVRKREAGLLKV